MASRSQGSSHFILWKTIAGHRALEDFDRDFAERAAISCLPSRLRYSPRGTFTQQRPHHE
jgi:hypothetical protein